MLALEAERDHLVEQLQALYSHMVQAKGAEDRAMSTATSRGGSLLQEVKALEGRLHHAAVRAAAATG